MVWVEIFVKDKSSRSPVWVQLRNRLIHLIRAGYFKPGDQLPSVRSLAVDAQINYNTVYKVYRSLERDGYITNVRGSGSYVNDVTECDRDEALDSADALVEDFVNRCLDAGMTYEEIPVIVMQCVMRMRSGGVISEDTSGRPSAPVRRRMRRGGVAASASGVPDRVDGVRATHDFVSYGADEPATSNGGV